MTRSISSPSPRRTFLALVGATAVGSGLGTALGPQESDDGQSIVLEQDGRCSQVEPLTGDEPVEDVYEYRYPTDRYDGPPGAEGTTYSSHGTTDLQRDDTSVLFLYDGPEGLSLVVVHGHLDGEGGGGTVRFTVEGLPTDGEWIVRDDSYRTDDGEQAESNFDRWDVDGEVHTIDWTYRGARTDGGAFRGLDTEFEVRIDPAFNEEAPLSSEHDFGPIERWEVLSGDRDAPQRRSLRLDRPLTIRRGKCPSSETPEADGDADARITRLSVADGIFTAGEDVPAEVTVENTGNRERTFSVAYSALDPQGEGHQDGGSTDENVTISAGETESVTVTWTVEGDAPNGSYDAEVVVRTGQDGNDRQNPLDDRRIESAFLVVND